MRQQRRAREGQRGAGAAAQSRAVLLGLLPGRAFTEGRTSSTTSRGQAPQGAPMPRAMVVSSGCAQCRWAFCRERVPEGEGLGSRNPSLCQVEPPPFGCLGGVTLGSGAARGRGLAVPGRDCNRARGCNKVRACSWSWGHKEKRGCEGKRGCEREEPRTLRLRRSSELC